MKKVGEIGTNIERLRQALRDCEDNLKGLNRQQLALEEDIEIKTSTLFIDQDQNLALRQQIQHKKYWSKSSNSINTKLHAKLFFYVS